MGSLYAEVRHVVMAVGEEAEGERLVQLHPVLAPCPAPVTVHLRDGWIDTPLVPGDTVHLLASLIPSPEGPHAVCDYKSGAEPLPLQASVSSSICALAPLKPPHSANVTPSFLSVDMRVSGGSGGVHATAVSRFCTRECSHCHARMFTWPRKLCSHRTPREFRRLFMPATQVARGNSLSQAR